MANKTVPVSFEALLATILKNFKLLLVGPAIVGLLTFGVVSLLPRWYTSVAYLKIDVAGARQADALMHSTPVLDKILVEFKAPQDTVEARRAFIDGNRRIVVAPGEIQMTSNLYRLEYSDRDPGVAQKVNSLFIEAWLDSTKLTSRERMAAEAEIARRELEAKSISQLIDRLQRDGLPPDSQSSRESSPLTPVSAMILERGKNLAAAAGLRRVLNGVPRDVVFSAPDLPEVSSWPKKGIITILAGFVAELLLLMFVIWRRISPL